MSESFTPTTPFPNLISALRYEIYRWLSIPPGSWKRNILDVLLKIALVRTVRLAQRFDQAVGKRGFALASREFIPDFVDRVTVSGSEWIPQHGPLILVCNHPGSIDSLVIAAQLNRPDIKMIARDMSLLRQLPGLNSCMIYSTPDMNQRASVLRRSIKHLEGGGALLLFASGNLDPDPATGDGAARALDIWTHSAALLLKKVPEARASVVITSRIINPAWYKHPLVRIQKRDWDRQFMAELLQTSTQILFPGRQRISPIVTFSLGFTARDLAGDPSVPNIHSRLVEYARRQLRAHTPSEDRLVTLQGIPGSPCNSVSEDQAPLWE